jgi:hypothetical protein
MDNFDASPAWLADGRIVFTRDPDGPAGMSGTCRVVNGDPSCGPGGPAVPELFLMEADGTGRVRVAEGRSAAIAPARR